MIGSEHYAKGEELIERSWNSTADTEVAILLIAHAQAHFTAALAYVALEERKRNRARQVGIC